MPLSTEGARFLAKAATGLNSPTLFSFANSGIAVGNNSTAFATSQTDLVAVGSGGQWFRKGLTSLNEAPGVITAVVNYNTTEANFEWLEWGWFNSPTSGGTMIGRKVEVGLGTKTSAQVWTLTATITFSAS